MLKSPSKFLSVNKLRAIVAGHTLSACGREYCREEARELLMQKEMRLAEREFNRELIERARCDYNAHMIKHQIRVFDSLGLLRGEGKDGQ